MQTTPIIHHINFIIIQHSRAFVKASGTISSFLEKMTDNRQLFYIVILPEKLLFMKKTAPCMLCTML